MFFPYVNLVSSEAHSLMFGLSFEDQRLRGWRYGCFVYVLCIGSSLLLSVSLHGTWCHWIPNLSGILQGRYGPPWALRPFECTLSYTLLYPALSLLCPLLFPRNLLYFLFCSFVISHSLSLWVIDIYIFCFKCRFY